MNLLTIFKGMFFSPLHNPTEIHRAAWAGEKSLFCSGWTDVAWVDSHVELQYSHFVEWENEEFSSIFFFPPGYFYEWLSVMVFMLCCAGGNHHSLRRSSSLMLTLYVNNTHISGYYMPRQGHIDGPEQKGIKWQGERTCEGKKVKCKERPFLGCSTLPAAG